MGRELLKGKEEIEDGGNKGGVAGVEVETQGITTVVQWREGSATGTGTSGGATCTD